MKQSIKNLLCFLIISIFFISFLSAQKNEKSIQKQSFNAQFSDRNAIIETIKNFYIGDHTGSIKHKKLSMHKNGAYRYVNKKGEYRESKFNLESNSADINYKEELLSIDIFDKVALAKLRLDQFKTEKPEYKLMILHKSKNSWKITSISWGFGVTQ